MQKQKSFQRVFIYRLWIFIWQLVLPFFVFSASADPILTVSTNNLNLRMPLGATSTIPYTITNSSNQTLTGLTIYPPALTQVLSTTCGDTLAPGALCTGRLFVQALNDRRGQLVLDPLKACVFGGTLCSVADTVNNQVQTDVGGIPFLYASGFGAGSVIIANTRDNVLATPSSIPVGTNPNRIAVSPNNRRAYVANQGATTVSVINTQTNTVLATINSSTNPVALVVSPDNRRLYFVGTDLNIHIVDTADNTETQEVGSTGSSLSLAITPDGRRLYTANSASLTEFTIATNQANTVPLTVDTLNTGLAVSPDGARLYITETGAAINPRVIVLDTANNTEITPRITVGTAVGQGARDIVISPDSRFVYVSNQTTAAVSVIDSTLPNASNPIFTTPPVVPSALVGLALSSNGRRLYACNFAGGGSQISVIDTSLMSATVSGVIAVIPVTTSLQFMAIMH